MAPVPFDDLLPVVEEALGRSPFEVFGNLEREPYAAGSIAQVHRANLASGTPVILKIRRPGIEAKDLEKLGVILGDRRKMLRANLEAWRTTPAATWFAVARCRLYLASVAAALLWCDPQHFLGR